MTTETYTYSTTLTVTSCGNCGIPFAIPDDLYRSRRLDGHWFYCPNGHLIGWAEQNEKARLERELKWAEDRAASAQAAADQAEASRRAWKGQATRARNKALVGECPFCGQHLRDLERHIGRQHADEAAKDPEAEPAE